MRFEFPFEDRVLGRELGRQAERLGDQPFLHTPLASYSFRDVHDRSQAIARGLRAQGLERGQPVMVMLDNCAEFVFAWFAVALLDAVFVPVNTQYAGDLLHYVAKDSSARGIITHAALVPACEALPDDCRAQLRTRICCGAAPSDGLAPGWIRWDDLAVDGQVIRPQTTPEDTALICYTSGTTGPSKGVVQTHSMPFQTMQTFVNAVGMTASDIAYAPLPMFHGMSRSMATLGALCLGAQVYLAPRFSATTFWEDVARARATISITIFTIPPILKRRPPSPNDRAHRLRVMFNAHHDTEFEARFGTRIVEAHGMTEVGLTIYTQFPDRKYGAAGRPGPEWEVMLADPHGRPVPVGSTGELLLRPRLPGIMMKGYLNKAETTVETWRDLWFHTGDLMRADAEGFHFYAGRMKERIRRRGENISAYEIQSVVLRHDEVVECLAVGVPAGDSEDDVYLLAVMQDSHATRPRDLHDWLSARLPRFMVPRYVEFRPALPKTPSGKIELHSVMKSVPAQGAWDSLAAR